MSLTFEKINKQAKAYIFELDQVLIPQKDYDLQVFYLFSQFMEYVEPSINAKILLEAMTERYKDHENEGMFESISKQFNLKPVYEENFDLLFTKAQLPLKLLLYKQSLAFLNFLNEQQKQIFILTMGNPVVQLNKIKQTEWHGLEKVLKVYFCDEYAPKPDAKSLEILLNENELTASEVIFIGSNMEDESFAKNANVNYYSGSFVF